VPGRGLKAALGHFLVDVGPKLLFNISLFARIAAVLPVSEIEGRRCYSRPR